MALNTRQSLSPDYIRAHVAELGERVFSGSTRQERDGSFDELVRLSRDPSVGRPQVEVGLELLKISRRSTRFGAEAQDALAKMREEWEMEGV